MHGGSPALPHHGVRILAVGSGPQDRGAEAEADQGAHVAAYHRRHLHAPHGERAQR